MNHGPEEGHPNRYLLLNGRDLPLAFGQQILKNSDLLSGLAAVRINRSQQGSPVSGEFVVVDQALRGGSPEGEHSSTAVESVEHTDQQ
jgi:hypothetical protein